MKEMCFMEEKFIAFAAEIIGVDSNSLSMDSSYLNGDWDSLTHLCLVDEICEEYGVDIPACDVADIDKLSDFYKYVIK